MKIPLSSIKSYLKQNNIYFSLDLAKERLSDTDDIVFSSSLVMENYIGIFKGNNLCSMGAFSYSCSPLDPLLKIGRYSSIARGLSFFGTGHPVNYASTSPFTYLPQKNSLLLKPYEDKNVIFNNSTYKGVGGAQGVRIGNDVWIGQNVTIKFGVTIGDGAIVAANSLVTKDVPPYTVFGGVPAKFIKNRFDDNLISRFLEAKWWEYDLTDLNGLNFANPHSFLDQLLSRKLDTYKPKTVTAANLLEYHYSSKSKDKLPLDVRDSVQFNYHFAEYGWINGISSDCAVELDSQLESIKITSSNPDITVLYSVLRDGKWYDYSSAEPIILDNYETHKPIQAVKFVVPQRKVFYRIMLKNKSWSKSFCDGEVASTNAKILGIHVAIV